MNITGKYLKVWEVKEQNGFTKLNLGDSVKLKDGTYENWTWFDCALVGQAKDLEVSRGDTIEVKSGLISKRKYQKTPEDKVVYFDNIVIFEAVVTKQAEQPKPDEPKTENPLNDTDDDSMPF